MRLFTMRRLINLHGCADKCRACCKTWRFAVVFGNGLEGDTHVFNLDEGGVRHGQRHWKERQLAIHFRNQSAASGDNYRAAPIDGAFYAG